MPYAIVAILVAGSICAAAGTVLLKVGATGRTELLAFVNIYVCSGLLLYGLGAIFWVYAMAKQSLISVYPFTILSFTLVYLSGIVLLGELPSRSAGVGVAFIFVGLYLIARNPT
jgi:drug/metabolite transporter (DMT)-like permease